MAIAVKLTIILYLIIAHAQATEMKILPNPTSQQLKEINLLKSIRACRQRIINLEGEQYSCITAVKQKPSKPIAGTVPSFSKIDLSAFQNKLDLLMDDIGVQHYTKQFIYLYKHKKIVSQYDDETTKVNNQKNVYENFTLGIISTNSHAGSENTNTNQKSQMRVIDISRIDPLHSPIDPIGISGQTKVQESAIYSEFDASAKSILHLSKPLPAGPQSEAMMYKLSCLNLEQMPPDASPVHVMRDMMGMKVTNNQLLLMDPFVCDSAVGIEPAHRTIKNLKNKVYVMKNVMFGSIFETCKISENHGVELKASLNIRTRRFAAAASRDDSLTQSYFQIEEDYVVEVQEVIGERLYRIDHQFQWNQVVEVIECEAIGNNKPLGYSGLVDFAYLQPYLGSVESELNKMNTNKNYMRLRYIGQTIITEHINPSSPNQQTSLQQNLELFCQFKITTIVNSKHFIFLNIMIGKKFHNNYYEFRLNGEKQDFKNSMRELLNFAEVDPKFKCFRYRNQEELKLLESKNQKMRAFTKVIEITKQGAKREIVPSPQDSNTIYYVTVPGSSIVVLETQIAREKDPDVSVATNLITSKEQGHSKASGAKEFNKYFITENRILKQQFRRFPNGTVSKIEKVENHYYENSTSGEAIIIYKGIWRNNDFLKFPRFLLQENQVISKIYTKFGYSYVRQINAALLNKEAIAVTSSQLDNSQMFGPRNRPMKSIATEMLFKGGTFCSGNANKHRETLVKIQCGEPWFKIEKVAQISVCSYELYVVSQFLCDKNVVFPLQSTVFNTYNGTLCTPVEEYIEGGITDQ